MSSIKAPRSIDVLFGRDTGSWSHEGNRFFRAVIREHQVEYHSKETRSEKMNIVAKIMGQMARLGARFLKLDKTNREWQEVGRKAVIEKVGHAIRDRHAIAQRRITRRSKAKKEVSARIKEVAVLSSSRASSDEPQYFAFDGKHDQKFLQERDNLSKAHQALREPIYYDTGLRTRSISGIDPSLYIPAKEPFLFRPRSQHLLDVLLPSLSPASTPEQNSAGLEACIRVARARQQKEYAAMLAAVRGAVLDNAIASINKRRNLTYQHHESLIKEAFLEAAKEKCLGFLKPSFRSPCFERELLQQIAQPASKGYSGLLSPRNEYLNALLPADGLALHNLSAVQQTNVLIRQSRKELEGVSALLALEASGIVPTREYNIM